MEIIQDSAFIIHTQEHNNTSQVVTVFSQNHGLISGYFKGGNSQKKKHICLCGNLIDFTWKARVISHLGTFEPELSQNFSTIFTEIHKSSIINTICELILTVLQKNDSHPEIFNEILKIFTNLKKIQNKNEILLTYTMFEISLMSLLGFGYNFSVCNISGNGTPKFISPKTGNAVNSTVANGFEDKLFEIPQFIQNNTNQNSFMEAKIYEIKKMLEINLHFLKLHLGLKSLPIREFTTNLF